LAEAFSNDWEKVRSLRLDGAPDETSWYAADSWWLSTAEE
jgi:protein-L-isoaspartate(D-aspartate) O-methyltransferase